MAAMPANTNTVTFSPPRHSSPECIHHTGHFMPWYARIADPWPPTLDNDCIAVAHTQA